MSAEDLILTPSGLWFRNRRFPVTTGRNGLTDEKAEGDMATPRGTHEIVAMMYRPDRIARAALPRWAVPIRLGDLWCDDPDDPEYNQLVSAPFAASAEQMRRPDPLYDLVLATDWNWPDAMPGEGSAIFLHACRGICYPTAGCVAFRPGDLLWIAQHIGEGSRLIVR